MTTIDGIAPIVVLAAPIIVLWLVGIIQRRADGRAHQSPSRRIDAWFERREQRWRSSEARPLVRLGPPSRDPRKAPNRRPAHDNKSAPLEVLGAMVRRQFRHQPVDVPEPRPTAAEPERVGE
jgi:hypothetical protein